MCQPRIAQWMLMHKDARVSIALNMEKTDGYLAISY